MKTILKQGVASGAVAVILSSVAPVLYFISRNYTLHAFTGNLYTVLASVCLGCVIAFLCRLVLALGIGKFAAARVAESRGWLYSVVAAASLAFFSHFAWREHPPVYGAGAILLCLSAILALSRRGNFKAVNVFLAAFCLISLVVWFNEERNDARHPASFPPPEGMPLSYKLKTTPNIYCFFLESFHSRASLKELFDHDFPEFYEKLDEMGFVTYEKSSGNYISTLLSVFSLFTMRHNYNQIAYGEQDGRRGAFNILAENSVFRILKNNGYAINIFDSLPSYIFRYQSRFIDGNYDAQIDSALYAVTDLLSAVNPALGALLRHISPIPQNAAGGEWRGKLGSFRDISPGYESLLKNAIAGASKPFFTFLHFGPPHSTKFAYHGDCAAIKDGDLELIPRYRSEFDGNATTLLRLLEETVSLDPNSVIIVTGDHGAYLHGLFHESCHGLSGRLAKGKSAQPAFDVIGLPQKRAAQSLLGVMLAVRWPDRLRGAVRPPADGLTHVNVFPHVFTAINGENPDPAQFEANYGFSQQFGNLNRYPWQDHNLYIQAKDGVFLDEWEVFTIPAEHVSDKR